MKFIARFLALIVAIAFILFLPLSLLGFNLGRVVFNRPLLKTVLTEAVTESQLIPSALAWFSEEVSAGLPLADATQDDLTAVLVSLTQEGWQAIRVEVLSDDILNGWVSSIVDSFYDWIDSGDHAPHFQLDMKSFKARMNSDFGFRALEIAYSALPSCEDAQVTEFLSMLETAVPGSNVYYPPCQFPELYRDDQLTDYLNSLVEVVNIIPDTFELSQQDSITSTPTSTEGWESLKTTLRLLRSTYWLGLPISVVLFALIWLFAIRSVRGFARWGGISLALAGIVTIILSWLPNAFLTGFLVSGPLQDTTPVLRDEILQVFSSLSQEVFSPMMIQGVIIFLIGGLIVVFVGGMMGMQKMTKKEREEPG
jgi:hypothetical protein